MFTEKMSYPNFKTDDEDEVRELSAMFATMRVDAYDSENQLDVLAAYCLRFEVENLEWAIDYCKTYCDSRKMEDIIFYTLAQSCMEANGY
jgi:hypothetical protein